MENFDYMLFQGGSYDIEFVVHAEKYSREQAIRFFTQEVVLNDGGEDPTEDDIERLFVRFYDEVPDVCGFDGDGGCYTYCNEDESGSFPVWVIRG